MSFRRSVSPPGRSRHFTFNRSRSSIDSDRSTHNSPPKPLLSYCTSPSHLEDITLDLDAADLTSPFTETFHSPGVKSSSICGRTVKEYEEQVRQLKKENFNLKLRLYFLEERMSKLGRDTDDTEDSERKLIELKVEMESMRRELKSKELLLGQAGKAIELMEEQHASELQKLRRDHEAQLMAPPTVSRLQELQHHRFQPLDNSMQLYAEAFNMRPSMFLSDVQKQGGEEQQRVEIGQQNNELQQKILELQELLEQSTVELEASREHGRQLTEALESKEPEIRIKVQELCQKDQMLEEQRKIIVEIQIRLDEKQKQLENLRQNLEASQATTTRLEIEHLSFQEKLRESEEKRNKAVKVIQGLMSKTQELTNQLREAKDRSNKAEWEARQSGPDDMGDMASEESERLWAELEQQRRHVERLVKENSNLLREKASSEQKLQQELADARLKLDRATRSSCNENRKENTSINEFGPTARMMLGRLNELAAFLSALLKRPHLLASMSPAHRNSLLQVIEESWGHTRRRFSLSVSLMWQEEQFSMCSDLGVSQLSTSGVAPGEKSLIGLIQAFLHGPDQEELLAEVQAQHERSFQMWPVDMTSVVGHGKEIEMITWPEEGEGALTPKRFSHHTFTEQRLDREDDEEDEEVGGGATAVERELPGSHNHSESEAWSEPDRSVSLARMGLPENTTPVSQSDRTVMVSPASSEADLITRTPGKRASVRRLATKLRDTEQMNEALRAELNVYQVLYKSTQSSPTKPQSPVEAAREAYQVSLLQEMQSQRSRLESLLKQNELIRQQLEISTLTASKGDESSETLSSQLRETSSNLEKSKARCVELEHKLEAMHSHCQALEAQALEHAKLHSQLLEARVQTQEALAALQAREVQLQQDVQEARQQLEQQTKTASERCHYLESALEKQDSERCSALVHEVQEAQALCVVLQKEVKSERLRYHQQEASKPSNTNVATQTIEKPTLNLGNSTGPSSLLHLSDSDETFHPDGNLERSLAVPVSPRRDEEEECDLARRPALSSPDLGIESDNGRMSSLEMPPSPGEEDERGRLCRENWRLKQRLSQSQQLMEACLQALSHKNKARQQVQAAMEKQLRRTEEVLVMAKANLRSLAPTSPDQTKGAKTSISGTPLCDLP